MTTLIINSRDPEAQWMNQIFKTMAGFDEVIVYIDEADSEFIERSEINFPEGVRVIFDGEHREVKDGYNFAASFASNEWLMFFCDDDYFIHGNVKELNEQVREGRFDDADIVFFKVFTGNGSWGATQDFSLDTLRECNMIPAGSLIRKSCFDKLGGFKISACADWNLWIRAKKANLRFKYFDKPVYFFRQGHFRSYTNQCIEKMGMDQIKREVLSNA